jgi:hypothetical protein
MTNQTAPVNPGGAGLINSGLTAGSLIYNQDSKNAVWLSSQPNVTPGFGIPLQPLGNVTWSGGPVYAIVDSGVTAPVNLTITSDVSGSDNPVAVGSAVAAQLLSKGVPSVFLGDILYNSSPSGRSLTLTGVSKYASLNIKLISLNQAQRWQIDYINNGSAMHVAQYQTSSASQGINIDTVVRGDTIQIFWTQNSQPVNIVVMGTNRTGADQVNAPLIPLTALLNQAFTSGTPVALINEYVSNGKQCYVRFVVTGGNNGFISISSLDAAGTSETILDLIDSKTGAAGSDGQEVEKFFIVPPGSYKIFFTPRNTATYTAVVTITPSA